MIRNNFIIKKGLVQKEVLVKTRNDIAPSEIMVQRMSTTPTRRIKEHSLCKAVWRIPKLIIIAYKKYI